MLFELDIRLTEEDYLAFNYFHTIQSSAGRKALVKGRLVFLAFIAVLMAFAVAIMGWSPFSQGYVLVMSILVAVYMLFYKKLWKQSVRKQVARLKKTGKLPFDAEARLEFGEDGFLEITPDKRMEQSYSALERICVVAQQYVYLYTTSVTAGILPFSQLDRQVNREDFLAFLSEKCSCVEYY